MGMRTNVYYTIETTIAEPRYGKRSNRVWRSVVWNKKSGVYGFHRAMNLVFNTNEECEQEIERRITKVVQSSTKIEEK
jgi:hypothetical protein